MTIIKSQDGKNVVVTARQKEVIDLLLSCRSGGMATVHGYKPSTGVIDQPIYNINMITKVSISKVYERKIQALLNDVTFEAVTELAQKDDKLKLLSSGELLEIYRTRKASEIASMQKTLDGNRNDAHRQGHDKYYARFGKGIKANVTELENGNYEIKSLMLTYLELGKTVVQEGSYKTVNSKAPVRVSKLIKKLTNQKSIGIKTLSLKEDNFTSLKIDRQELLPVKLNESVRDEFAESLNALYEKFKDIL